MFNGYYCDNDIVKLGLYVLCYINFTASFMDGYLDTSLHKVYLKVFYV